MPNYSRALNFGRDKAAHFIEKSFELFALPRQIELVTAGVLRENPNNNVVK